jgi:hypothetical protein
MRDHRDEVSLRLLGAGLGAPIAHLKDRANSQTAELQRTHVASDRNERAILANEDGSVIAE